MESQQSVIINYNPNFANGDASDFTQPFNKQLEIPPNSEVAFYQGQLQRKTVVIPESESIEVDYVEQLPTDKFRTDAATVYPTIDATELPTKLDKDTITIKKGSYTQSEFVESFRSELQEAINRRHNLDYTNDAEVDFLYQATGENDEIGLFLGLSIDNQNVELQFTSNVGSEVIQAGGTIDLTTQTFTPASTVDNWNQFLTLGYPMNPLGAVQSSYPAKLEDQQNTFFYDLNFNPVTSTEQRVYVGFLNSALTSNVWTNPTTPQIISAYPEHTSAADGVPLSFFGIEYVADTNSSDNTILTGSIYLNNEFIKPSSYGTDDTFTTNYENILKGQTSFDDIFGSHMAKVYSFEVADAFTPHQGIRFYSITEKSGIEDPDGLETQETRNYYFQILSKTYQDNGLYGYKGGDAVLFDSKDFGIKLPQRLVEDAGAGQCFISDRDRTKRQFLGIQPYIFMRNCHTSTSIYRPNGSTIVQNYSDNNFSMINQPIIRYNYKFPKGSTIRQILGTGRSYQDVTKFSTEEARFDPNIYPQSRGRQAGVNALYSDNQRYNFEVDSLPIRTFNSTKNTNNVSGNERTILHSTESFIDGEVTELQNAFLNKNIVPSTLKYISLNNNQKVVLNDIAVKITRADTNVTATEITDASFEMLIRSKKSKQE